MDPSFRRAVEAVWRIESPRIIASLARMLGDVGLAEDFAQEALLAALDKWTADGVPDHAGPWLMLTAKNRARDELRRRKMQDQKRDMLAGDPDTANPTTSEIEDAIDDATGGLPDDVLRLVFVACHPVLSPEARVALTLKLVGGLTTEEIAHAFLTPEPTVAQRIVRAKKTIADARVPFEAPRGHELHERLSSVLEVVYLIFNEGYAATSGGDWVRPALCEDALRLGRIVAAQLPDEIEVQGLVALMELQASRLRARVGPNGELVTLADQNRAQWDTLLIQRGLAALDRARAIGGAFGPYALQASIAACHARARTLDETEWGRIAALYDALTQVVPSPVVELNRGVAHGMAFGPEAGLAIIDGLLSEPKLAGYHLLPAVRGDLLSKLGRSKEARAELERAATMTANAREKVLLRDRAAALAPLSEAPPLRGEN